jgi:FkbM family methyltransferase
MNIRPFICGNISKIASYLFRFRNLDIADAFLSNLECGGYLKRGFGDNNLFVDVSRGRGASLVYMKGRRYIKEECIIEGVVGEGMTVIDVGANIGYYMLIFAEKVGKSGSVLCFEPNPKNAKDINVNRKKNGLSNVFVKEKAVGKECGRVKITEEVNSKVSDSNNGRIEVSLVSIDEEVEGKIDAIKIDVEGYEGDVLEGAKNTIVEQKPNLLIEIHPNLRTEHKHSDLYGFVKRNYSKVECYEIKRQAVVEKIMNRYLEYEQVVEVSDADRLINRCDKGIRRSTFWITGVE